MFRTRTGSLKRIFGMAYDRGKLFAELDRRLTADPCLRLKQPARDLGVERHTIEDIVREIKSTTFRRYQKGKLLQKTRVIIRKKPNSSGKEIAAELGYRSSKSFSRFIKRATGWSMTEIRRGGIKLRLRRKL